MSTSADASRPFASWAGPAKSTLVLATQQRRTPAAPRRRVMSGAPPSVLNSAMARSSTRQTSVSGPRKGPGVVA